MAIRYNEDEGIARFEFPVLVLLATTGMMVMISANDLITLYVGLELQNLSLYVVASFNREFGAVERGRAQILRPRWAVLGHAALRRLARLRLYRHHRLRRARQDARGRRAGLDRADHRPRLCHRRPRLQGVRGAVPHVDPRCLRGRPDPGHRVLRCRPQDGGAGLVPALHARAVRAADRGMAPDHRLFVDRLDGVRRGRRDRPDQHQAADGLQLDRPCRLCADRPHHRHGGRDSRRARLSGDLSVHEPRHLGGHPVHAPAGTYARGDLGSRRALALAASAGLGIGDLHVRPDRDPADRRLLRQALHLPRRDRRQALRARRDRRRHQRRRRGLLPARRQGHVFRRGERAPSIARSQPSSRACCS